MSRKQLTIAHSTFPHLTVPWGGGGINYIDLPNKLFFLALPQVSKFLDMINQARGCKTPGWQGNLAVNSKGCAGINCLCDGCELRRVHFETNLDMQVALIVAGSTYMGYYKTLKHALGIDVVSPTTFMDTICNMYPIVKSMLDQI